MTTALTRRQVLGFRVRAQQLDRERGSVATTTALDLGMQNTGPDGARWALAVRGVEVAGIAPDVALAWTLRGAPHLYRRADLAGVAAAVAPWSNADAGKRIYDAAKPLKAAGIDNLAALDAIAAQMRTIVVAPMVKGELSGRLAAVLPAPYLRACRPCGTTHLHEMPFRLAALRAGLELQADTSPPVLAPIAGFAPLAGAPPELDVVRGYLRLLGPATPRHVAGYLDAPVKEVQARWPGDAEEVTVDGETRWLLAGDLAAAAAGDPGGTRLLGPFDLYLQARDRTTLVPDAAHAKDLWRILGRPGAVLVDGEIAGTWRPRAAGGKLTVAVTLWRAGTPALRAGIEEQAQQLASYRHAELTQVSLTG